MEPALKLLCVLAHPDDESLGLGGLIAKYAAEGADVYIITATRGEKGWFGAPEDYPGPEALGQIREAELHSAARVLGVRAGAFLDYIDGELDQADPDEAIAQIAGHIRRLQPQVVVTFDPYGAYGHPDHIAISQFTAAAIVTAADSTHAPADQAAPHRVAKLYYFVGTDALLSAYEAAFGEVKMTIDGVERRGVSWPAWSITTKIATYAYADQIWEAIACHKTQISGYEALRTLPEAHQRALWGEQDLYRVFSLVNGGREIETDIFAGIRQRSRSSA
ncbi:MAG: PIG-L family deacetylase [Chloroflexi bacterium]|nr:PIG-L family deacetylase [Chloroflexota bacterium]